MENISSKLLRYHWNTFRLSKQHICLPESSLIGGKESTAMFTIAGMQQLIPYLSGKDHPLGKRLFNIQKCIRTVDIDEVGDASHLTFFEMMGNWSLGDYFKKESVQRSREFLVEVLRFDPKKLAVTVFEGDEHAPRDDETAGYRLEAGIPQDKIAYMGADNNRWSPGPVGPCGPDTEIFYRIGDTQYPPISSNPKTDEDHWLEIRNNVFIQFYRDDTGLLTPLKNKNVDTGMGLERMAKVLQNTPTVFETDIFAPLINIVAENTGKTYKGNEKTFRIIVDHFRAAANLINEGIIPSNVGPGYVLRKIIRRMYYKMFGDWRSYTFSPLSIINNLYIRSEIDSDKADILCKEIENFQTTIHKGKSMLLAFIDKSNGNISAKEAFLLFDTYGFPLELTKEIASEKGINVDVVGFEQEMEKQRARSRAGSKDMFKQGIDWATYTQGIPQTTFVGYDTLQTDDMKVLKDFEVNGQRILIFDITPFYAESGGQMGDRGVLVLNNGSKVDVVQVQKYNGIFLHFVE